MVSCTHTTKWHSTVAAISRPKRAKLCAAMIAETGVIVPDTGDICFYTCRHLQDLTHHMVLFANGEKARAMRIELHVFTHLYVDVSVQCMLYFCKKNVYHTGSSCLHVFICYPYQ